MILIASPSDGLTFHCCCGWEGEGQAEASMWRWPLWTAAVCTDGSWLTARWEESSRALHASEQKDPKEKEIQGGRESAFFQEDFLATSVSSSGCWWSSPPGVSGPWQLPYNASFENIYLHAGGPMFNPWHLQLFLNITLLKIVTSIPGN